ncbi:site-specific integrase [Marinifilum caeruleilacunae]|uniref:Site-specific integrase n=1 Tax=Marinifilum caeruleilacunae TaxID=2499076 RepID=A0ABX1X2B1_9BACT|nr:site-specific integrase [Marinifilum caeruleilacunae]NOU62266.1 site-specific integrase [Marinifilum caeruleilacunae]
MTCTKVSLRRRPISRGRYSLHLDYYPGIRNPVTMRISRYENLGIYIYQSPKTAIQKEYNQEMLRKAEAIRSIRVQNLINEDYGFLDKHKLKACFLTYFREKALAKNMKSFSAYKHFENFVKGKCTFEEITVPLCQQFQAYLLQANNLKHKSKKLSQNSAAAYYCVFRSILKIAYREKLLHENLNEYLESTEVEDTKKEFLTLDEVKLLADTPCKHPVMKRASLFACLTGLRMSDIIKLDWDEIVMAPDGEYCMRIRTEKTEKETTLPISNEALELCGEREPGLVFKGLTKHMIFVHVPKWVAQSGIKKKITFHCFRHTFATLQIALGTDIYTVSKMLDHKNVTTTQIYANLVNSKKRESANKISLK